MWKAIEHTLIEVGGFILTAISLFVVNRLGFISRHSFFWKSITLITVLIIDLAVVWVAFTQKENPFKLQLSFDKVGQISKVKIIKSPITISLHGGQIINDSLIFFDSDNRKYFALMSKPYSNSSLEIDLIPKLPLLGHSKWAWGSGMDFYWVRPIGKRWIKVIDFDFLILIFLLPGSFLLWYGGTKGKDPPELQE